MTPISAIRKGHLYHGVIPAQYSGLGTPRPRIGSVVHRPDVSLIRQAVAVARSDDANHGSTLSFWWLDPLAHGWARNSMMREREIGRGFSRGE